MAKEEDLASDWEASLSRIPRFAGVSPALMERIIPWLRRKSFRGGEIFVREGDSPEWLIFVEKGRAKVFRKVAEEREIIFGIFGPGETLGEIAVLEQIPYPASIQALDPLRCLFLPASFYLSLLEREPEFAIATIRDLSMRVFYLIRRIHGNAGHAEFRLFRLFYVLAIREGKRTERDTLFLPLAFTRKDLADLTGTRLETIVRLLTFWKKKGLVAEHDQGLEFLNLQEFLKRGFLTLEELGELESRPRA